MNGFKKIPTVAMAAATLLAFSPAMAVDPAKVPENKRTTLGLYMTSVEANDHLGTSAARTLFLDIRDPTELQTLGMPTNADANVPFKFIDISKWDAEKGRFGMKKNPEFITGVAARLEAKGLKRTDTVIAMCGSGKRVPRAVDILAKAGYTNVYAVVDGYKGWQKAKLPHSRKMEQSKMYGNPQ